MKRICLVVAVIGALLPALQTYGLDGLGCREPAKWISTKGSFHNPRNWSSVYDKDNDPDSFQYVPCGSAYLYNGGTINVLSNATLEWLNNNHGTINVSSASHLTAFLSATGPQSYIENNGTISSGQVSVAEGALLKNSGTIDSEHLILNEGGIIQGPGSFQFDTFDVTDGNLESAYINVAGLTRVFGVLDIDGFSTLHTKDLFLGDLHANAIAANGHVIVEESCFINGSIGLGFGALFDALTQPINAYNDAIFVVKSVSLLNGRAGLFLGGGSITIGTGGVGQFGTIPESETVIGINSSVRVSGPPDPPYSTGLWISNHKLTSFGGIVVESGGTMLVQGEALLDYHPDYPAGVHVHGVGSLWKTTSDHHIHSYGVPREVPLFKVRSNAEAECLRAKIVGGWGAWIDNGYWTIGESLTLNESGSLVLENGGSILVGTLDCQVPFDPECVPVPNTLTVRPSGELILSEAGIVNLNDSIISGDVVIDGTLTFNMYGIEWADLAVIPTLTVEGSMHMNGTLHLNVAGVGFPSGVYPLIIADELVGQFSEIIITGNLAGDTFEFDYETGELLINIEPCVVCDTFDESSISDLWQVIETHPSILSVQQSAGTLNMQFMANEGDEALAGVIADDWTLSLADDLAMKVTFSLNENMDVTSGEAGLVIAAIFDAPEDPLDFTSGIVVAFKKTDANMLVVELVALANGNVVFDLYDEFEESDGILHIAFDAEEDLFIIGEGEYNDPKAIEIQGLRALASASEFTVFLGAESSGHVMPSSGSWFDDFYVNAGTVLSTPKTAPGDLNGDGVVDVSDLLLLLSQWGSCPTGGGCIADINGDGVVNVLDLLILLENWG